MIPRTRRIPIALALAVICFGAACGSETERRDWPVPGADDAAGADPATRRATPSSPDDPGPEALPASALGRGKLLVATRRMRGDFFARTVVLLLDYSPTGALGVVVNRPTTVGLTDLLPALDSVPDPLDRVHLGGPVDPGRMVFLIRAAVAPHDGRRIFADVHATGSALALRQAIERDESPARFHAYVGYAGWGPGQLDAEVARGDWYVAPAAAELIFDPATDDLWDRLVLDFEGVPIRWSIPRHRIGRITDLL